RQEDRPVLSCLRHSYETQPDLMHALQTLGKLWLLGIEPEWKSFYASEKRHRVLLPPYPFQRQRYWIETRDDQQRAAEKVIGDSLHGTEWFYVPSWKRMQLAPSSTTRRSLLIFTDALGLGEEVAKQLENRGASVARIAWGASPENISSAIRACGPEGILY